MATNKSSYPTRVLIAHRKPDVRRQLAESVERLGFEVTASVDSTHEIRECVEKDRPAVILTGIKLVDGDAIRVLIEVSAEEPLPAIVITSRDSLREVERALQDHVMAYLLEPVDVDEIQATIYLVLRRFEQFQTLRAEVEDLKQALSDRKVIERAKGILMSRAHLDEAEAFRRLQKLASEKRTKLAAIAQAIVTAQEALAD